MASHPKPSAKNESGEYATFENALKKVLSVPHSELKSSLPKAEETKVFRFPRGKRKGLVGRGGSHLASDLREGQSLSRNLR